MAENEDNDSWEIFLESLEGDINKNSNDTNSNDAEEGKPLDDVKMNFEMKQFDHRLNALSQQNKEKRQSHKLRKRQLGKLFWITTIWISLLWFVILLQGFKGWFFPIPTNYEKLPFQLDKAELIALITTTTATVLGLYTIAAMWLFGKEKVDASKSENNSNSDSD